MTRLTPRQRHVIAECVRVAAHENAAFPLPAAEVSDFAAAVEAGTAHPEQDEAAAVIAAYAPLAQPVFGSRDWRTLSRALHAFRADPEDAHPHWRDLVSHHLKIGAYSR